VTPESACGVCGASRTEPLWTVRALDAPDRRYPVVRCTGCGIARTLSPPAAARRALYDADYSGGAETKLLGPVERMRRTLARGRARRIVRGLPAGARVLDVGCGDGKLTASLLDAGVRAVGLEGSRGPAHRAAVSTGGRVAIGDPDHLPFARHTFDAIVIWHVLEHLPEPRRTLAELARCLSPTGLLVVAVPDFGGWTARFAGAEWYGLDPERHLYHFTTAALTALLAQQGFVVRRRRHMNLELTVVDVIETAFRSLGLGRLGFYRHLMTAGRRNGTRIASLALAALCLPFALVAAIAAGALGGGTDVQVWAERPSGADAGGGKHPARG
jgi:2-polyprenyl-3-methyl-5-hydroxy-6-metoxy-1,4-benzoquinol methylase